MPSQQLRIFIFLSFFAFFVIFPWSTEAKPANLKRWKSFVQRDFALNFKTEKLLREAKLILESSGTLETDSKSGKIVWEIHSPAKTQWVITNDAVEIFGSDGQSQQKISLATLGPELQIVRYFFSVDLEELFRSFDVSETSERQLRLVPKQKMRIEEALILFDKKGFPLEILLKNPGDESKIIFSQKKQGSK